MSFKSILRVQNFYPAMRLKNIIILILSQQEFEVRVISLLYFYFSKYNSRIKSIHHVSRETLQTYM